MDKIFMREEYLNKIMGFYDSDIIKVVTGIRRCGKSCFLLSVIEDLKSKGVSEKNIVNINLDKRGFKKIKTVDIIGKSTTSSKACFITDNINSINIVEYPLLLEMLIAS